MSVLGKKVVFNPIILLKNWGVSLKILMQTTGLDPQNVGDFWKACQFCEYAVNEYFSVSS